MAVEILPDGFQDFSHIIAPGSLIGRLVESTNIAQTGHLQLGENSHFVLYLSKNRDENSSLSLKAKKIEDFTIEKFISLIENERLVSLEEREGKIELGMAGNEEDHQRVTEIKVTMQDATGEKVTATLDRETVTFKTIHFDEHLKSILMQALTDLRQLSIEEDEESTETVKPPLTSVTMQQIKESGNTEETAGLKNRGLTNKHLQQLLADVREPGFVAFITRAALQNLHNTENRKAERAHDKVEEQKVKVAQEEQTENIKFNTRKAQDVAETIYISLVTHSPASLFL